ncbi:MAG: hypothetical protein ABI080_15255, partial [Candidatus Binatia bacterium]
KERAAFASDETLLAATIGKSCGAAAIADLRSAAGLGFAGEDAPCLAEGGSAPVSAAEVAACVQRGHACRADQLVAFEAPRAVELLTLVGQDTSTLPCLATGADGGGTGVGDATRAQALERCGKALQGASATFARGKTKAVGKCLRALEGCLYEDGVAAAPCLDGAGATCAKAIATLTRPGNGVEAKLVAAISSGCGTAAFADVLGATGLGYGALASTCSALGGAPLDSSSALATCVVRQHECRVEQWLERETPRLRELIDLGNTPLP